MRDMSRLKAIAGYVDFAAAERMAAAPIASAAATTVAFGQIPEFAPEENAAFRPGLAEYEKMTGDKIDCSIMSFMARYLQTALTNSDSDVPDLMFHDAPQNAWTDGLIEADDAAEIKKAKLNLPLLAGPSFYNCKTKTRGYYLLADRTRATPCDHH